jgi:hypothetical protein
MITAATVRRLLLLSSALLFAAGAARAQPGAPFTFIAIGDEGQVGEAHSSVAAATNAVAGRLASSGSPLGMLLFLGDNFYPHGLNGVGDEWQRLRDAIIAPYRDLAARLGRQNVRAIAGNHDYYCRAVNTIPYGFCVTGNQRERAMPEWTYSYYWPVGLRHAMSEGGADSVELILFDSSYLLTRPTIFWRRPLDSLERLLRASAAAPGVRFRILVAHHSPRTIGEHAGWRAWLPGLKRVGYIGNCMREGQDPFRYIYEFFSTQDLCSDRYRWYNDSLDGIIARSGAHVQAILSGHEHSLQFMHYPDYGCANCPKIFIVSGAGSKHERVKSPVPPHEFSHPLNDDANKGESAPGFIVGTFAGGKLRIEFIDGRDGSALDMGGRSAFVVDEAGSLVDAR